MSSINAISVASAELEGGRISEPLRTMILSGDYSYTQLLGYIMRPESQQAWCPDDGYAEERTLEDYKILKKLELLELVFDGLGERIIGTDLLSMDVNKFFDLKESIEAATTIEEIKSLTIGTVE